jgi:hypothetical protein
VDAAASSSSSSVLGVGPPVPNAVKNEKVLTHLHTEGLHGRFLPCGNRCISAVSWPIWLIFCSF